MSALRCSFTVLAAGELRVATVDNLGPNPGRAVAGIGQGKHVGAAERDPLVLLAALPRPVAERP